MELRSEVRQVTSADFPAIAAITNHFIRDTTTHFGWDEVTPAQLEAEWQRTRDVYPWLVATQDGAIAGYAKASVWRSREAYRWTPETGIYIRDEFRHRGIGTRLYRRLLAVLRDQGYRSVIAGITLPNEVSIRLHERLGFEPCGVIRDAGCKHGAWHDVGFWQLRLRTDDQPCRELRTPDQAFEASA